MITFKKLVLGLLLLPALARAQGRIPTIYADTVKVGTNLQFGLSSNSAATGSAADVALTTPITLLTNASLTSVRNFSGQSNATVSIIKNGKASGAITLVNDSGGTAANRILTGTGADLDLEAGASIIMAYDTVNSRWQIVGGSGGFLSPMTTNGDMIVQASGDPARLALGATNSVLVSDGSAPTWGTIVNAGVNASAGIAMTKLEALTPSTAVVTDGSGFLRSHSTTTSAQIGYLDIGSSLTTLLGAKAAANNATFSGTFTGPWTAGVLISSAGGVVTNEAQLSSTRGGTSVNNAGSLTYGANNITLTTSGATGVTLPTSGTLATLAGSEIFTNKTLTNPSVNGQVVDYIDSTATTLPAAPASGKNRLFSTADGEWYSEMSNGAVKVLTRIVGYLYDGDAESGAEATYWATYADAAGASLVDGTGGSPSSTWARSTSNTITGYGSFIWTKSANNRQGEGVCNLITLSSEAGAKVMETKFDYSITSGTFVAGSSSTVSDMVVNIYDVTNSVFIQPSTYKLFSSTTSPPAQFSGYWQTPAIAPGSTAQFRVCLHTASTSALAYVLKVDNFTTDRAKYAYGTPVTDWVSWTPTGSWSTNTTYTGFRRRVGQNEEFQLKIATAGAPTSAPLTVNLPDAIDTAIAGTNVVLPFTTSGFVSDSDANTYGAHVVYSSATVVALKYTNLDFNFANITQAAPFTFASGDYLNVKFTVPIAGWSSSVQMSDSGDQRVVAMQVNQLAPTATINGSYSLVKFTTAPAQDTHAAFSTSTGLYTVPIAGFYRVTFSMAIVGTFTSAQVVGASIYKNGVETHSQGIAVPAGTAVSVYPHNVTTVYCNAGDTLGPYALSNGSSNSVGGPASVNYFSVERVSGPSAIGATEFVGMKYISTAGTSVANSGDINIPFATKDYDTHGAYSGSIYTCPISGRYGVSATVRFASAAYAVGNTMYAMLYKNGAFANAGTVLVVQAIVTQAIGVPTVSTTIQCNAGDTLEIRAFNSRTAGATTLETTAGVNHVEIERIGL